MTDIEKSASIAIIEIARQLKIANSLKKVEMCYNFEKTYDKVSCPKLWDDFNQAIDMAFDRR